jgi:hypothetical protein
MVDPRTEQIAVRTTPEIKRAVTRAALADRRTVSALVEMLLVDWLTKHGYLEPEPQR